jgi:hypothetical protein
MTAPTAFVVPNGVSQERLLCQWCASLFETAKGIEPTPVTFIGEHQCSNCGTKVTAPPMIGWHR